MRLKSSFIIGALSLALLAASTASAQVQTGSIQGTVTDQTTGVPMLLVTVVASSTALQGTQSEFTDDSGQFFMNGLPTGSYSLLFIYGDAKVKRENVEVGVGKTTVVNAKINTQSTGEVITIKEKAPTIDAGSTKQGTTLQQDYMKNVPNRGRTWQGVLGAAAGSQGDTYGTSFSGSTSVENTYVVDGINTSGVTLGSGFPTQGSGVLQNFIQEIEVITGGYNAEFGRSTGGVVNVVTKTGSNEFHGSVFGNVQALSASTDLVPDASNAIRYDFQQPTSVDFGFEVGGPIIKDRLWFYVGFAPQIARTSVKRVVSHVVDRKVSNFNYNQSGCAPNSVDGTCDGDGNPLTTSADGCERLPKLADGSTACEADEINDFDANGLDLYEQIESKNLKQSLNNYSFTGKLNFAVAPEHQGQIGIVGTPTVGSNIISGLPGTPTATQRNETNLSTDVGLKWTSKFFDNKTQVDATVGWHRFKRDAQSVNDELPASPGMKTVDTPAIVLIDNGAARNRFLTVGAVANNTDVPESQAVKDQCIDGGDSDLFPSVRNCPIALDGYYYNSRGSANSDQLEQRWQGKLSVSQRVKALGHHSLKAGVDFENNILDNERRLNGGVRYQTKRPGWEEFRYVTLNDNGTDYCTNDSGDTTTPCTYLNSLPVHGRTVNYGAYLQDSWSILPNLTINAGLRYEQQYLKYADQLKGTMDPITDKAIGTNAMSLTNLWAPRVGLIYDWTKEGRSKVYANWGRFYESIPMDINDRSFGGEVTYNERWAYGSCGKGSVAANYPQFPSQPDQCPDPRMQAPDLAFIVGAQDPAYGIPKGVSLVMPNTSAQYLDEIVVGVEYEVLEDLRVGVAYQNRRLGRVIEDLSTDGATTYFIGNPGEFSQGAEDDLLKQIHSFDPIDGEDPVTADARATKRAQLRTRLASFQQTRNFDTPERVYNALQLTASKRFSRDFMVQASYTYSVLKGNYPGLFSPDTDQLDPNITSMYDLIELMSNRNGNLPFDRPHAFKLDGYYKFDLKEAGQVTAGARFRAQSGVPITPLGAHSVYGSSESFLMPRGSWGRTDLETNVDLHVAYGRKIGSMDLEVFFELFNVLNNQGEIAVDTEYTGSFVDPIVGASKKDLYYLKEYTGGVTGENDTIPKNLNFANTLARQAPLSARIGLNLAF